MMIRHASLRFKQWTLRKSTSLPFISGDGFASLISNELKQVYFCKSEEVEEALEHFGSLANPFVLVAGNSDRDFVQNDFLLPENLKRLYLQNSFICDDKRIRTLPIGVENLRHAMNGFPHLLRSKVDFVRKANKILIGPFGNTHSERESLARITSSSELVLSKDRLNVKEYAKFAATFRFVACPRGNGVDTHRVWETLYRGSIPIVIRNDWSNSLDYLGLPVIKVSSWDKDELLNVIAQYSKNLPEKSTNLDFLWAGTWKQLFSRDLA
jgi:hypothetical protein